MVGLVLKGKKVSRYIDEIYTMNAAVADGYIHITSFFYSDKSDGWFPMDELGRVYYRGDFIGDDSEDEEFWDDFDEEDDVDENGNVYYRGKHFYLKDIKESDDVVDLCRVRIRNCKVIPENAFSHCYNLETVIMDDTVEQIESNAFHKCESLRYIRMSANIQQIDQYAFFNCPKITSMFIPDSCIKIDDAAFKGCLMITVFAVSSTTHLGKNVVASCKRLLEHSPFHNMDLYYEHNVNINDWLSTRFQDLPLHQLCSSPRIRSLQLYQRFQELGRKEGLKTDYQNMNALHILMSSPYVTGQDDTILAVYLKHCPEAGIQLDVFERTPLECLEQKIVGCTVSMLETYVKYCPEIEMKECFERVRSKAYPLLDGFVSDTETSMVLKVFEYYCPNKDHHDIINVTKSYLMNVSNDYYPDPEQDA